MSPRERFETALAGGVPDRVPVAAWGHFYQDEWDPARLAAATLAARARHDWDWVKLNPRATYFAEAFGGEYLPGSGATGPSLTRPALPTGDWSQVHALDGVSGVFDEHLQALRLVRSGIGPDIPLLATIFSPLTVANYLVGRDLGALHASLRGDPAPVEHALSELATTLSRYAAACLSAGADGIFFAVSGHARKGSLSREEFDRFGVAHDLAVLRGLEGGHVLHLCGDDVHLDLADRYPVRALSLAPSPSNPHLSALREGTSRALMTGVHQELMLSGAAADVARSARAAVSASEGRGFLLAPGCSVSPAAPVENLEALAFAVRPGVPR
ncbi:MAG: uroporphyrinogen decarboxylase family protein [Candidatus Dormibacteria bacterium]